MANSTRVSIEQMRRDVAVLFDDGLTNQIEIDPSVVTLGKEICDDIISSTFLFYRNTCTPFEPNWVTLRFEGNLCVAIGICYRVNKQKGDEVLFRRVRIRKLHLIY